MQSRVAYETPVDIWCTRLCRIVRCVAISVIFLAYSAFLKLDQESSGHSYTQMLYCHDVAHHRILGLRRTFDITLASLGVPLYVSDKLLNHEGEISGLRATNNRNSYMPEMREAVAAFEEHLDTICNS